MIRWMPAANSVWAVALHVIVLVLAWPLGVLSALYYFPDIIAYTISCFISRDNMTDLSSRAKLLQRGVHPKALDEMSTSSSGNELDMDQHELAADWDSAYIDGDGCRLHARIAGSAGPLMLLVHGFPECSYSWRHQLRYFSARGFRVCAIDLRGFGQSDRPTTSWWNSHHSCLPAMIEDLRCVIEALGYAHAHTIVGHDIGGVVASLAAQAYPSEFRRLVLCNTAHPQHFAQNLARSPNQWARSWYMLLFQLPLIPEILLSLRGNRVMVNTITGDFSGCTTENAVLDEDIQIYKLGACTLSRLSSMLAFYRCSLLPSQPNESALKFAPLESRHTPALLLWGSSDAFLEYGVNDGLEEQFPLLTRRMIPGASHWVQFDCPDEFNEVLEAWLTHEGRRDVWGRESIEAKLQGSRESWGAEHRTRGGVASVFSGETGGGESLRSRGSIVAFGSPVLRRRQRNSESATLQYSSQRERAQISRDAASAAIPVDDVVPFEQPGLWVEMPEGGLVEWEESLERRRNQRLRYGVGMRREVPEDASRTSHRNPLSRPRPRFRGQTSGHATGPGPGPGPGPGASYDPRASMGYSRHSGVDQREGGRLKEGEEDDDGEIDEVDEVDEIDATQMTRSSNSLHHRHRISAANGLQADRQVPGTASVGMDNGVAWVSSSSLPSPSVNDGPRVRVYPTHGVDLDIDMNSQGTNNAGTRTIDPAQHPAQDDEIPVESIETNPLFGVRMTRAAAQPQSSSELQVPEADSRQEARISSSLSSAVASRTASDSNSADDSDGSKSNRSNKQAPRGTPGGGGVSTAGNGLDHLLAFGSRFRTGKGSKRRRAPRSAPQESLAKGKAALKPGSLAAAAAAGNGSGGGSAPSLQSQPDRPVGPLQAAISSTLAKRCHIGGSQERPSNDAGALHGSSGAGNDVLRRGPSIRDSTDDLVVGTTHAFGGEQRRQGHAVDEGSGESEGQGHVVDEGSGGSEGQGGHGDRGSIGALARGRHNSEPDITISTKPSMYKPSRQLRDKIKRRVSVDGWPDPSRSRSRSQIEADSDSDYESAITSLPGADTKSPNLSRSPSEHFVRVRQTRPPVTLVPSERMTAARGGRVPRPVRIKMNGTGRGIQQRSSLGTSGAGRSLSARGKGLAPAAAAAAAASGSDERRRRHDTTLDATAYRFSRSTDTGKAAGSGNRTSVEPRARANQKHVRIAGLDPSGIERDSSSSGSSSDSNSNDVRDESQRDSRTKQTHHRDITDASDSDYDGYVGISPSPSPSQGTRSKIPGSGSGSRGKSRRGKNKDKDKDKDIRDQQEQARFPPGRKPVGGPASGSDRKKSMNRSRTEEQDEFDLRLSSPLEGPQGLNSGNKRRQRYQRQERSAGSPRLRLLDPRRGLAGQRDGLEVDDYNGDSGIGSSSANKVVGSRATGESSSRRRQSVGRGKSKGLKGDRRLFAGGGGITRGSDYLAVLHEQTMM